jgi:hypothetical protein
MVCGFVRCAASAVAPARCCCCPLLLLSAVAAVCQVEYVEETHPPNRETLLKLFAAVDKRDKYRLFKLPVTDEQVRRGDKRAGVFTCASVCCMGYCLHAHVYCLCLHPQASYFWPSKAGTLDWCCT